MEIKLTKMLLVLSETELLKCLCREPAIMTAALRRGKALARYYKEQNRTGKNKEGLPDGCSHESR